MKAFLLISIFFYSQITMAFPPVGAIGQSGTAAIYPVTNKTPYNQITNLGSGIALIETGNENMLVNPNFEHATANSGWTCTTGTCTATTTSGEFSSGKKAMKVVINNQTMNISQTVATPSGIVKQGVVGISYRVPSAITNFNIVVTVDSVVQTTVAASSLIADDAYHSIEIPTIFGATDVKIGLVTSSASPASNYSLFFDNAYIKQGLGLAGIQLDNVYSAESSVGGVVSRENTDFILNDCTNANPSVCTFKTGIFTEAPNCQVTAVSGGSNFCIATTSATTISINCYADGGGPTTTSTVKTIQCQKSGNDYLAASSSVYSQASADYSGRNDGVITIGATTTPPTKGTIVTDRVISSRYGNRLLAHYQYEQSTGGAAGSGEYLISLPAGLSFDTNEVIPTTGAIISATTSGAVSKSFVGIGSWGASLGSGYHGICKLYAYNSTQFRAQCFYENGAGGAGLNSDSTFSSTGFALSNAGIGFSWELSAPISGWSNSSQIVGSFAGVPAVPGYQGNVDTFSFTFGTTNATTVCSASPCTFLDQIGTTVSSVTRASAGVYSAVLAKTYTKLKCTATGSNAASTPSTFRSMNCSSCSAIPVLSYNIDAAPPIVQDTTATVVCQGAY